MSITPRAARRWRRQGGSRTTRFSGWQESERLAGNLHRAYGELDGHPLGTRIPLDMVWPDMVALHGGPIGCLA